MKRSLGCTSSAQFVLFLSGEICNVMSVGLVCVMRGLSEMSAKKKQEAIIVTSIFRCSEEKNYSKGYNVTLSLVNVLQKLALQAILRAKIVSFWLAFR